MNRGSLAVVGTGIRFFSQITEEARRAIQTADHVLYLADKATEEWIQKNSRSSEPLQHFYAPGKLRKITYAEMVDRILRFVQQDLDVCAAFYGHPGIFGYPSHESIRRARANGYRATMLPGISAQDCLFADLDLDPGTAGYQSFEATDFLVYKREFDLHTPLILWQIHVIGNLTYDPETSRNGLTVLAGVLAQHYGPYHQVILYEAPQQPLAEPMVVRLTIDELPAGPVGKATTLLIPPLPWR